MTVEDGGHVLGHLKKDCLHASRGHSEGMGRGEAVSTGEDGMADIGRFGGKYIEPDRCEPSLFEGLFEDIKVLN